jgi:hypothetical protein
MGMGKRLYPDLGLDLDLDLDLGPDRDRDRDRKVGAAGGRG